MLTRLEMTSCPPYDTSQELDKGHVEYWVFMQSREIALQQSTEVAHTQVWNQAADSPYEQIEEQIKDVLLAATGDL